MRVERLASFSVEACPVWDYNIYDVIDVQELPACRQAKGFSETDGVCIY